VWRGKVIEWRDSTRHFFQVLCLYCQPLSISIILASGRAQTSVVQSQTAFSVSLPAFSHRNFCYFFEPAMSSTSGLLKVALSYFDARMQSLPGGGIAGEEEYKDWALAAEKDLVRRKTFYFSSPI
jgi:hypothetical protein